MRVIVLGRYPRDEDLKDGYFQRVKLVDSVLARAGKRMYLRTDGPISQLWPSMERLSEDVEEARISRRNPFHKPTPLKAIEGGCVYAHSIRILETPIALTYFQSAKVRILDLHGAVPEEEEMAGNNDRVSFFESLEREGVLSATHLVGMNQAILDHIVEKYGFPGKTIVLPHAKPVSNKLDLSRKEQLVVYAGGLQPWQQVDKMLQYAHKNASEAKFVFLVPDVAALLAKYRSMFGEECPHEVRSASPSEVQDIYRRARFGLVLREDSVVNRVASPTKLQEYMEFGVVPIVDFVGLGDFETMGYERVSCTNTLPDRAQAEAMALKNFVVVKQIESQQKVGEARLLAVLNQTPPDTG